MNIQNELNKATFDSGFAVLPDGTMVYKPVFSKTRYIVPTLTVKENIEKSIVFTQEVGASSFALSLLFVFMNKWLGSELAFAGYLLTILIYLAILMMMNKRMVKGLQPYTTDNHAINAR